MMSLFHFFHNRPMLFATCQVLIAVIAVLSFPFMIDGAVIWEAVLFGCAFIVILIVVSDMYAQKYFKMQNYIRYMIRREV